MHGTYGKHFKISWWVRAQKRCLNMLPNFSFLQRGWTVSGEWQRLNSARLGCRTTGRWTCSVASRGYQGWVGQSGRTRIPWACCWIIFCTTVNKQLNATEEKNYKTSSPPMRWRKRQQIGLQDQVYYMIYLCKCLLTVGTRLDSSPHNDYCCNSQRVHKAGFTHILRTGCIFFQSRFWRDR